MAVTIDFLVRYGSIKACNQHILSMVNYCAHGKTSHAKRQMRARAPINAVELGRKQHREAIRLILCVNWLLQLEH